MNGLVDAIYIKGLDGRVLYCNEAAARLASRSVTDVIGAFDRDLLSPEALRTVLEEERRILETGSPEVNVRELQYADGKTYVLEANKFLYRDATGQVAGTIIVSKDITDHQRTTLALKQRELTLNAVIEQSPDPIYIKDLTGVYLHINSAAARIVGLPLSEILGRDDFAFFPAQEAERMRAYDRQVIERGEPVEDEQTIFLPDGTENWFQGIKYPYRSASGAIVGVIGTTRNITERKQMEAALRKSEMLLAEAEQIGQFGSWETDLKTLEVTWSAGLYRIYGFDRATTRASRELMFSMIHPDDVDAVREAIASADTDLSPFEFERRVFRTDGRLRVLHSRGGYILDPEGRPIRRLGTSWDVTERKHVESELQGALVELERLNHLKDDFISNISHEFRTPLSVIRNAASIIKRQQAGPTSADQQRFSTMILDYVDRLARMVDDLLDFQKGQADPARALLVPGDVGEILRIAADELRHVFESRHIAFSVTVNEAPLVALVNRDGLVQAIHNLLVNAAKFTPEGGRVAVLGERDGANIIVAIEDTGVGILPEDLSRVFRPFVQVPDNSGGVGGAGLGLAICKKLVESIHGGRLWVESTPGRGSTFFISLPELRPE